MPTLNVELFPVKHLMQFFNTIDNRTSKIDCSGCLGFNLQLVSLLQDNYTASLYLNHTLPTLKNLGIPANTAVAMNSGSHGNGTFFYVWSGNAGNQRVKVKKGYSRFHQFN